MISLRQQRTLDPPRSESLEGQIRTANGSASLRNRLLIKDAGLVSHGRDIRDFDGSRDLLYTGGLELRPRWPRTRTIEL
jgi:hypothetical protein